MRELNYPIILCSKKFIRGKIQNETQLCIGAKFALKEKMYANAVIYDSKCNKYSIYRYKKKFSLYVVFLNVINGIFDLFRRPKDEYSVWVDFELKDEGRLTFSQCKSEIAAFVNAKPRWFVKSHEDYASVEEKFASFDSIEELINCEEGYSD